MNNRSNDGPSEQQTVTSQPSDDRRITQQKVVPRNNQPVKSNVNTKSSGSTDNSTVPGKGKTISTEDEKRTKDMLNNIWNSLKANNSLPMPMPIPALGNPAVGGPPTGLPGLDLTETLKKCLKIAPNSSSTSSGGSNELPQKPESEAIQQPSPAQLPPPPANWRIEAQIQHLNQRKPPAPPQPHQQVPMPVPLIPNMMHNDMRMQPPPPMYMMPMPQMGFGPRGYNSRPPMPMPPFRPVATMPFPRPPPYMNGPPGPMPNRPYNQPMRNQKPYPNSNNNSGPQPGPNKLAGPNALRNTASVSGHGAFIPLQAARKITKMKSQNGNSSGESKKEKETATATEKKPEPLEVAKKSDDSSKDKPKKLVVNNTPSKPQSGPRPARIAANFSVNEE